MSDFHFRRLESQSAGRTANGMLINFPLPKSPSGKTYRWCPVPECTPSLFLLGAPPPNQTIADGQSHLIRRSPKTPGTTCPYCGHDAPDKEYISQDDIEAAKKYISWAAMQDISDHFRQLANDINRRQSTNSFIKLTMTYKGGNEPKPSVWREDLLRDLTCDICGRAYGVYAVGLFCPDCGARNIHVHFLREIELIR